MSLIQKFGYLSTDINTWISKHRSENEEWFQLAEELNTFAHTSILNLEIDNKDFQKLLVAAAFLRAHSAFQGGIITVERGMIYEAAPLFRA